jgi:hypothetical protein
LAFGRDFAIHAALDAGGFAARLISEARRLSGFRDAAPADAIAEGELGRSTAGRAPAAEDAGDDPEPEHTKDGEGQTGPARQDDL